MEFKMYIRVYLHMEPDKKKKKEKKRKKKHAKNRPFPPLISLISFPLSVARGDVFPVIRHCRLEEKSVGPQVREIASS